MSLYAAVTAATLWDFRLFDLRIFDGAALALFGLWLALTPEPLSGFLERRRRYWVIFLTVVVYAAAGHLLHGHKSSLAIMALAAIGFLVVGRMDWLQRVGPFLWAVVCIHIFFFTVQIVAYYEFDHAIIDFQNLIGQKSRLIVNEDHMRAAALFQEPNSYSLNLFMLASVAILWWNNRVLVLLAAFTMILSESLWGLGAGLVLIFMGEMQRQHSWRRLTYALTITFVFLGTLFYGYLWIYKNPISDVPYFYMRMKSLLVDDGSVQERYFRNTCVRADRPGQMNVAPEKYMTSLLIGDGLSTIHFQQCLPVNGISFLSKSFGAAGMILLLAGIAIALAGLPVGAKLFFVMAIGFSFTSYPLVTYVFFWFWLPTLFGLIRFDRSEPAASPDAAPSKLNL